MKRLFLFGVFLIANAAISFAQSTSGSITGLVTDSTGAVIPNAEVAATDVNKGLVLRTTSSQDGYYTYARLPEGLYRLSISKPGFKTLVQEHVLVNVNTSIRIDAQLAVGQSAQSVEVSAYNPLLQTERGDVATTLSEQMVSTLPTLGRNVASLQLLTPGATQDTFQIGSGENPQGSVNVASNGQPNGARDVMLDGTDDQDSLLGLDAIIPTQDSVGSFAMTTAGWDPEYGRAGAAITQLTTKSGSNQLHGTLFEFVQNNATNAADPFTQPNGAPHFVFNQFGGSVGSRILKDKLFYFGDVQAERQRILNTAVASLPNAQMLNGDFSSYTGPNGAVIPIFDPETGNPDGTGRTQFPGNIIPQSRLNSIAEKILALLPPVPANNGIRYSDNLIAKASTSFDTAQYTGRLDYYFSDKTRAFIRNIYFRSDLYAPGVYGRNGGGPPIDSNSGGNSTGQNDSLAANLTHVFSDHLFLDLRFGWTRYEIQNYQPDSGLQLDNQVGLNGINNGSLDQSGLSTITIAGPGSFQMGGGVTCNCPLHQVWNYFQYAANLTKVAGNHAFKFGTDVRHYHNLRITNDQLRGTFAFSNTNTGSFDVDSAGGLSGSGLASMLIDQVNNWSQQANYQSDIGNEIQDHIFGYGQDAWKITPKLTLNYGLRYEIYTPPSTPKGAGGNFDPTTGMVEVAGIGQVSDRVNVTTNFLNLAPRISAAYRVRHNTVTRLALARSYFPNVFDVLISGTYPLVAFSQYVPTSNYQTTFTLESPRPSVVFPVVPASGEFMLPSNQSVTYNPSHRPTGYVDTWNLAIEQAIGSSMAFTISYVGNRGRDLYYNIPVNDPVPGPGPEVENRPFYRKFGFTNNITDRTNGTHSNYNSLQVQFDKHASKGLAIIANYAWSKVIDFGLYNVVANPYDINQDRAVADYNVKQSFSLGHIYQIPVGRGERFLSNLSSPAELALGGWEFSGITMLRSGFPFSVIDSSNATLNSTFTLRPDFVGTPYPAHRSTAEWFNTAAFATPGLYRQGTAPRNFLTGPGFIETDWSLGKHFKWENYNLEFRTDAFNAINRKNLATPNNTWGDASAGTISDISGESSMRKLQFGLHLRF